MKKIIKRILLVILILAMLFYIYRISLFLYAYNVIDKKIVQNLSKGYSVKMSYDNGHDIQIWKNDKFVKTSFYVDENIEDIGESVDNWYDIENKIEIRELDGKILNVNYVTDGAAYIPFFTPDVAGYGFTTFCRPNYIKEHWQLVKETGFLYFLESIFVIPATVIDEIKTEIIDGKECYVITSKLMQSTKYIDKEAMLPYKTNSYESTNVVYEYSFDPITKESLKFPNTDEYYVIMQ